MKIAGMTGIHSNTIYKFEQGGSILPLYLDAIHTFVKSHEGRAAAAAAG